MQLDLGTALLHSREPAFIPTPSGQDVLMPSWLRAFLTTPPNSLFPSAHVSSQLTPIIPSPSATVHSDSNVWARKHLKLNPSAAVPTLVPTSWGYTQSWWYDRCACPSNHRSLSRYFALSTPVTFWPALHSEPLLMNNRKMLVWYHADM